MATTNYDVIVIGGGSAGLAAGVILARSRRSVAVIDAGHPRNAPADGVHNFLTREGTPPAELLAVGRREFTGYGGTLIEAEATDASRDGDGFAVELDDGRRLAGRRLLITTGLRDELPDIPGLTERWGHDVLHCPYCHGWEVRDQQIAIIGTGPMAAHGASLFRQLTDRVTLCLHNAPLDDEQRTRLAARDVRITDSPVETLVVDSDRLVGLRLTDGTVVDADAVVVAPRFVANSAVLTSLGVEVREHEMGVGRHVVVDPMQRTSVPGVYAAGNVSNLMAQVISAASEGSAAGAMINADLVTEDFDRAVARAGVPA
ncbi:NAD(P)/FAD-dependent oxidoreductase [uncultured Jatrophihabitans sp.]|uniref:NAD(P)/FAD-dependent oxidoreductase n=1 Tax=uncultured Jatrophihabitans sp. TaxID=1610747 RepID=UPI0035CA7957